jgi:hypothetical protein
LKEIFFEPHLQLIYNPGNTIRLHSNDKMAALLKFGIASITKVPDENSHSDAHHNNEVAIATTNEQLLISSPYTELHHQLDLSTLDVQSALFARALTTLHPVTVQYATSPYTDSLSWSEVVQELQHLCAKEGHVWTRQSFYVVAFYSKLQAGTDRSLLHQLDKESHGEAAISGGLLKYWFGSPNNERRNLATCKCFPVRQSPT